MQSVLLLGASGQLGRLVGQSAPDNISLHSYPRDLLDITNLSALKQAFGTIKPDVIINTAAYTAVDKAEDESQAAFAVNSNAVAHLAKAAPAEALIIHISTDFVFSKMNTQPYKPEDTPSPFSVYGESKLAGEQALLAGHPGRAIILRTSWLYSALSKNFVTVMLELMGSREELNVVNDQYGSPTSAPTLADVIWRFTSALTTSGIYHWSDKGVITWYDFAREIQEQALAIGILDRKISINPIPTSDYPTPAKRPAYSALDSTSTEKLLGIQTPPWQEQLHKVLKSINEMEIDS